MERLVTTSAAAEILGLSLQGVHYRIKKNKLKSIKKSGRIYVYIDEADFKSKDKIESISTSIKHNDKRDNSDINSILESKNEQIGLLKESIKWMKKQYTSEIKRLEKNQKRIINVFNSEIKLLQSAFNEMRSIYKPQIIQNLNQKSEKEERKDTFLSLRDFFIFMKRHQKSEKEIKYIIFKAIKKNDHRFIYNKKEKKLLILNEDFEDLI